MYNAWDELQVINRTESMWRCRYGCYSNATADGYGDNLPSLSANSHLIDLFALSYI